MRSAGTLAKWNDERGFGFILPNQAGDEIFVHISAFPKDGIRPRIGEVLSFEIANLDGKQRAVAIERPGRSRPKRSGHKPRTAAAASPWPARILGAFVLVMAGLVVKNAYQNRASSLVDIGSRSAVASQEATRSPEFTCDGRIHCSQMRSYEEALFFVQHCPNTQMDGDGDGDPCENQF